MKKLIGFICLLAGTTLVIAALVLTARNFMEQKEAGENVQEMMTLYDEAVDSSEDTQNKEVRDEETPLYKLYPDMEMPAIEVNGYRCIGTIELPSAGIRLPVMEEWDYTRLNISPCRFYGSAYTNDLVIAGHDYPYHFTPIKDLAIGSPVVFTDVEGNVFEYRVSRTEVLRPTEVEAMQSEVEGNEWDLTLFTCTFSGSDRYTVRCVLTE